MTSPAADAPDPAPGPAHDPSHDRAAGSSADPAAGSALDAALVQILACPTSDHAPVREVQDAAGHGLGCTECGRRYPVRDGIPVMLISEATGGPTSGDAGPKDTDPSTVDGAGPAT